MPYQYVREPLTTDECDRLSNACETPTDWLVVWTLLVFELRVSGVSGLNFSDHHTQPEFDRKCRVQFRPWAA